MYLSVAFCTAAQLFDLVLGNILFCQFFERVVCITANIAHCNLGSLAFFLYVLYQLLTALLGKLRKYQADTLAVIAGIQAQIRCEDGLLDRF